jgi:hypothetical protein
MSDRNPAAPAPAREVSADVGLYVRRHLRIGWWLILFFATLGFVLEGMHAFKLGWYLNVSNESRRLMWSLAHAHGALLGLVHLGFAATLAWGVSRMTSLGRWASQALTSGSLLLPFGFLLGGAFLHGSDPGYGILLVPVGACLLLFTAACAPLLVARDPYRDLHP